MGQATWRGHQRPVRAGALPRIPQAEQELRVAQTEFDRQAEVTRLLLEGISSTHVSLGGGGLFTPQPLPCPNTPRAGTAPCPPQVNHLRCLHEFVESQTTYYAQCYRHMLDLQKQLGRCCGPPVPCSGLEVGVGRGQPHHLTVPSLCFPHAASSQGAM